MRKHLCLLVLISLLVSCSDPEDSVPESWDPANPVGNYKLFHVDKFWVEITPYSHTSHSENITTECDLMCTLNFKSNNTFAINDFNYNNNSNCSDFEIVTGTWTKTGSYAGGFVGDFDFENSFRGLSSYDENYVHGNAGINGKDLKLNFKTTINGQEYYYTYYFEKL